MSKKPLKKVIYGMHQTFRGKSHVNIQVIHIDAKVHSRHYGIFTPGHLKSKIPRLMERGNMECYHKGFHG